MKYLIVIIITVILLSTCNKRDLSLFNPKTYFPDEQNGLPIKTYKNDTPEHVLENLKASYNYKLYDLYKSILHEDYKFYMSLTYFGYYNRSSEVPDPTAWQSEINDSSGIITNYYKDKNQDLKSIQNLFNPVGNAKKIELSFNYSCTDTKTDTASCFLTNIELIIILRNYNEPLLAQGEADLTVIKNDKDEWNILIWEDMTFGKDSE